MPGLTGRQENKFKIKKIKIIIYINIIQCHTIAILCKFPKDNSLEN